MSLSRLLLVAANSKKYIEGERRDRIEVKPQSSGPSYAGEVVLCFQLDNPRDKGKQVAHSLGIQDTDKRCDGLIFYAQDDKEDRIFCLVEMKSENIKDAALQIKSTKDHFKELLRKECESHCNKQFNRIKWKACFYHHGSSPDDVNDTLKQLKKDGFDDMDDFTATNNDAGPLLRNESGRNAKELAKNYQRDNKRKR